MDSPGLGMKTGEPIAGRRKRPRMLEDSHARMIGTRGRLGKGSYQMRGKNFVVGVGLVLAILEGGGWGPGFQSPSGSSGRLRGGAAAVIDVNLNGDGDKMDEVDAHILLIKENPPGLQLKKEDSTY